MDCQFDVGPHPAAHAIHGFGQGQPQNRFSVKLRNQVASLDSGAEGWCVINRRNHHDQTAFHGDLDAKAAEFALGLHLHIPEILFVEKAGMGIERSQHAIDRRFDQLGIGDLFHIIHPYPFEDLSEQVELTVGCGIVFLGKNIKGAENKKNSNRCRPTKSLHQPLTFL